MSRTTEEQTTVSLVLLLLNTLFEFNQLKLFNFQLYNVATYRKLIEPWRSILRSLAAELPL